MTITACVAQGVYHDSLPSSDKWLGTMVLTFLLKSLNMSSDFRKQELLSDLPYLLKTYLVRNNRTLKTHSISDPQNSYSI